MQRTNTVCRLLSYTLFLDGLRTIYQGTRAHVPVVHTVVK